MALTVADIQTEVVNLYGRLMDLVEIYDGVPQAGSPLTSRYTNAAIRDGFTRMGYNLADPNGLVVVDTDMASLNTLALRRLMEWSGLYLLEQVDRDWWRAEATAIFRYPGLASRVENGIFVDPLSRIYSKVKGQISQLKIDTIKPYQSMNQPLAIAQITIGTACDPSLPPSLANIIPPWALAPDGIWIYGIPSGTFWGWGEWGGGW